MTIRLATAQDIDVIFDIRTQVKENHLSKQQLTELGITEAAVLALLVDAPCIWVAEIDQQVRGFSMADLQEGSLFAVFIHPEFEAKGLGKLLLQQAEACLFENFEQIWLETAKASRAFEFYTRQAWSVSEYYANGDVRMLKRRTAPN